ncbi:hypothetical protein H0H81_000572 [Sphagnurus paluster]|uniref:Uncharacterized protein n=1 Tax=Sphagnurus paluster TaxID=117069 RepID=A0A9P7FWD9_9AGAR|nr:hypothetical protein H0H81_000572 [Sphagnurus paluster]
MLGELLGEMPNLESLCIRDEDMLYLPDVVELGPRSLILPKLRDFQLLSSPSRCATILNALVHPISQSIQLWFHYHCEDTNATFGVLGDQLSRNIRPVHLRVDNHYGLNWESSGQSATCSGSVEQSLSRLAIRMDDTGASRFRSICETSLLSTLETFHAHRLCFSVNAWREIFGNLPNLREIEVWRDGRNLVDALFPTGQDSDQVLFRKLETLLLDDQDMAYVGSKMSVVDCGELLECMRIRQSLATPLHKLDLRNNVFVNDYKVVQLREVVKEVTWDGRSFFKCQGEWNGTAIKEIEQQGMEFPVIEAQYDDWVASDIVW